MELGPALIIALIVLFAMLSLAFLFAGVATANYACQLAAREGASGGSRTNIDRLARTAVQNVVAGPFGQFASLQFTNLQVNIFEVGPGGTELGVPAPTAIDTTRTYLVRVQSPYTIGVPFWGTVNATATSECFVDNPESLAIP